ncbi:MAG: hypothetical protein HY807_07845 [Nitrospirae bacterium]|nr:hypothetical protein [Nitrospirota bacterium]
MNKTITCILLFLLSGCATTVPLPPQIDIYNPSPETSPKLAAFSGAWEGIWNSRLDTVLVVERIDSVSAQVGFGLGQSGETDIIPQNLYWHLKARIINDSSIGWTTNNGNEFIYKIDESLNKITGTFIDKSWGSPGIVYMSRIKAEDFPDVQIKYHDFMELARRMKSDNLFTTLAGGVWSRIEYSDSDCNNNSHSIVFNSDKSEAAFIFQKPVYSADANNLVDKYKIININGDTLTMSLIGETRKDDSGNTAVWNLVFEEPDKYYWHRSDWPDNKKFSITKKCKGT